MKKRSTSNLAPYHFKQKDLYVFLQRRTLDAPCDPGTLDLFGGAIETGESYEDGLIRELQEELEYTPQNYEELGIFETDNSISMIYIEKVAEDFENTVVVHEGERGEWHKAVEVIGRSDIVQKARRAVNTMIKELNL